MPTLQNLTERFPPLSALATGTILFEICLDFRNEHPVQRPHQNELSVRRGSDHREFGISIGGLKFSVCATWDRTKASCSSLFYLHFSMRFGFNHFVKFGF
jgi:hypothetical protein